MYQHKTIIDINGYIVEKVVLFKEGEPQEFALEEGQQAVEYLNKTQIVNGRNVEYLKPQWNGTEWIETATEEELNEAYPIIEVGPTEIELLKAQLETANRTISLQSDRIKQVETDAITFQDFILETLGGN